MILYYQKDLILSKEEINKARTFNFYFVSSIGICEHVTLAPCDLLYVSKHEHKLLPEKVKIFSRNRICKLFCM